MFFPTYKTPNKGFLGVLHDWDPRWGPPETPPFSPKVKKVKSALQGFEFRGCLLTGHDCSCCLPPRSMLCPSKHWQQRLHVLSALTCNIQGVLRKMKNHAGSTPYIQFGIIGCACRFFHEIFLWLTALLLAG